MLAFYSPLLSEVVTRLWSAFGFSAAYYDLVSPACPNALLLTTLVESSLENLSPLHTLLPLLVALHITLMRLLPLTFNKVAAAALALILGSLWSTSTLESLWSWDGVEILAALLLGMSTAGAHFYWRLSANIQPYLLLCAFLLLGGPSYHSLGTPPSDPQTVMQGSRGWVSTPHFWLLQHKQIRSMLKGHPSAGTPQSFHFLLPLILNAQLWIAFSDKLISRKLHPFKGPIHYMDSIQDR